MLVIRSAGLIRVAQPPPPDDDILHRRRGQAWRKLQFEPHEMAEAHLTAARQLEPIAEEERPLVPDDLSRQEKVDLAVRDGRCRHDLQPTSGVRDAGDLPPIAEDEGLVVAGPEDLHDFADAGGVRRYQS